MSHRRRGNPFRRKAVKGRRLPNVTRGQRRPSRMPRDPVFRVRGLINQGVRDTNVPTSNFPRRRIPKTKRRIRQELQVRGSRFT